MQTPINRNSKEWNKEQRKNKDDSTNETKHREESEQNNQTKICKSVALNVDPFQANSNPQEKKPQSRRETVEN